MGLFYLSMNRLYSDNTRTENDLKESIQCVVFSASPVEFRSAKNSTFVGCDASLRATRDFPAPSLHMVIKKLILTEMY